MSKINPLDWEEFDIGKDRKRVKKLKEKKARKEMKNKRKKEKYVKKNN